MRAIKTLGCGLAHGKTNSAALRATIRQKTKSALVVIFDLPAPRIVFQETPPQKNPFFVYLASFLFFAMAITLIGEIGIGSYGRRL
jgi:hypothetical protein